jgi:hypothetical protein
MMVMPALPMTAMIPIAIVLALLRISMKMEFAMPTIFFRASMAIWTAMEMEYRMA